MKQFKPYSHYRPTNINWINQVPKHWSIGRIKNIMWEIDRRTVDGSEPLLSLTRAYGLIRYSKLNKKTPSSSSLISYKLCIKNEIVMNRMQAWSGMFDLACETGLVSPDYSILVPRPEMCPKYLVYVFRSKRFIEQFALRSKGIGSGFNRLYWNQLGQIEIFYPALEEQKAIVRFLDFKTTQISRLIYKKKRLIALLKEQKQAIINQTVTRGLDPNIRLKPSGVEWLEDLPVHWKLKRIRTVAKVKASGIDKHSQEGEIPINLCNYMDVYKNNEITNDINFMRATATTEEIRNFELQPDDVIITKDSESWKDIAVPSYVAEKLENVVCGYHLALLRPFTSQLSGAFLCAAISSDPIANQFRISATGVTRYGLSQGSIKDAIIPVPSIEEQRSIAIYIKDRCKKINQTILHASKEIDLIQEYRTRLISDVVTGKIDIRNIKIEEFDDADIQDELIDIEELDEESLALAEVADEND